MRFYQMTLLLLPMLLLTVGCGVETVEESGVGDANILDPASADFHFQNLPLAGGSLIPPEEIPVVTIEKTREDAEFFYWQLKADPAPIHEDLVVSVFLVPHTLVFFENVRTRREAFWDAGLALEDQEVTVQVSLSQMWENFVNEGYFPRWGGQWNPIAWTYGWGPSVWLAAAEWDPIVVVIPKLQNTSQEFKLPLSYVVDPAHSGFIKANELPELPPLRRGADPAEAAEARIWVDGTPIVVDGPSMMRYHLNVSSPGETAAYIGNNRLLHAGEVRAHLDIPIFQTFEGYILREGFAFSYYSLGEAMELELQR